MRASPHPKTSQPSLGMKSRYDVKCPRYKKRIPQNMDILCDLCTTIWIILKFSQVSEPNFTLMYWLTISYKRYPARLFLRGHTMPRRPGAGEAFNALRTSRGIVTIPWFRRLPPKQKTHEYVWLSNLLTLTPRSYYLTTHNTQLFLIFNLSFCFLIFAF